MYSLVTLLRWPRLSSVVMVLNKFNEFLHPPDYAACPQFKRDTTLNNLKDLERKGLTLTLPKGK